MTKETETQLENKIANLRNRLEKLQEKRIVRELNKYVGKCYKLKNCYSDKERWYEYLKVMKLDKDNNLECLLFRKDTKGELIIQRNYSTPHYSSLRKVWKEITEQEFTVEWKTMLSEINSYYK